MMIVTAESRSTDAPASGVEPTADPAGTVECGCDDTSARRPAALIAEIASAWRIPATSGTEMRSGPRETVNDTTSPAATAEPADGVERITRPTATFSSNTLLTSPTASRASAMSWRAVAASDPTTFGTVTESTGLASTVTLSVAESLTAPLLTVRVTRYLPGCENW